MSLSSANSQMSTAFDIRWPDDGDGAPATPLVFASPHSGRLYPEDMNPALDSLCIRRSEDARVDDLIDQAPVFGAPMICALTARAYLDVNRDPCELDPRLFAGALPVEARALSPRVAAGLGVVARVASGGAEIYDRLSPVYLADYATADDGTGLVHSSPAYGLDDFQLLVLRRSSWLMDESPVAQDGWHRPSVQLEYSGHQFLLNHCAPGCPNFV